MMRLLQAKGDFRSPSSGCILNWRNLRWRLIVPIVIDSLIFLLLGMFLSYVLMRAFSANLEGSGGYQSCRKAGAHCAHDRGPRRKHAC